MYHTKRIAIILPDTLQSSGLQSILTEYFAPVETNCFSTYESFMATGGDIFDYYFTLSETFVLNVDFFLPRKSKTVILSDCPLCGASQSAYTNLLTVRAPLETLIEQIQQLFENDVTNLGTSEGNKELSAREMEVLQLVVKGIINKEIADKLNISLNTVLSHRKNITAKLGIKTVSGLIFYAIMHGIISAEDIDL